MLDPTNLNKVITSTYIYNNPESIKRAQAEGWIIDPIQNPQGILHHTYGLNTKQKYIDTLIEEYKKNIAKHMYELDRAQQLRNLTLNEKRAIFNNTVKKVPVGSSFNRPNDVTQAVKVAKNSLRLSNNSNSNNTPAADGAVSKGWRKWLYNQTIGRCVGPKCKNTGGRRTRRTKSRRAKTRRARRS